ncbi:hypothetical protein LMB42_07030 [Limosilactobacillus reuteri]|uniref:hypothetical protein n=1 Tax=Limosilactobacillus reuteri TaxID=1598 RepID=UPI001E442B90|nr:hypothetical protein [Limosilactobacillus reuteri]MCC4324014.1 hypothetical protein [Limosilactobacillus reuteri]MCC4334195.1 hypothetical protein [Limosilactobacillus reuteri]
MNNSKNRQLIIVPHPKRSEKDLTISDNGKEEKFTIFFDGFRRSTDKNEDPFIWNDNFLYTFCHGNEVFTKSLINNFSKANTDKDDIFLVFVSPTIFNDAKHFAIDTIIKIKKLVKLPNDRSKASLKKALNNTNFKEDTITNILTYHFPGSKGKEFIEHNRKNLYIAVGDAEESFLPMVASESKNSNYYPFIFDKTSSSQIKKIIQANSGSSHGYYVAKKSSNRFTKYKCCKLKEKFEAIRKQIINNVIDNNKIYKLKGNQIKNEMDKLRK